jgi:hypothetical protein
MAENRPPQRERRLKRGVQALAVALFALVAAPSYADLKPRARPRVPPMRFVHVVSADRACKPDCPEWLSAEGRIEPGTAKVFAGAIANLKGRRLPILIHSPGGSVADAAAMGELIRASGLAVAVARTLVTNCPEASPKCLAAPSALIGVHQITTVVSQTEGLAHLKSTRKFYEQQGVDSAVEAYLTAMGVGEPVMTLMRKTWAASIRWLSPAELKDSHLATFALDPAEPILTSGANGLNARALDGDPPRADLMQASLVRPLAEDGATLAIAFRYRRGGGAVEAETIERGLKAPQGADASTSGLSLSAAGVEAFPLRTAGTARTLIPRERFCALAHGGASIAAAAGEPRDLALVELAALDGAHTLIAEACP